MNDRHLIEDLRRHTDPPALTPGRRTEMRMAIDERVTADRFLPWLLSTATAVAVALLAVVVLGPRRAHDSLEHHAVDLTRWEESLLLPVDPTDAVHLETEALLPPDYRVLASYLDR